ncbi:MAG: DEAD/DEAH box helicase [Clostridium sp.]|nr:DEAD/DEAH box helicase [Clostridium sp.]
MELRPYQKEIIDIIDNLNSGSYLVQLATGLGKTVTFANIKRKGRVLVLAHREELVTQPIKYYDVPVGIEMRELKSKGEEVVIASVQSLVRRLNKFNKDDFDMIITDECHHSIAKSYRKIYDYFNYRLHIGFTATPNRGDGKSLDGIFDSIIYEKDIRWAIENKYLCDIHCMRVNIDYDISKVKTRLGDYALDDLEEMINNDDSNKKVALAYKKYGIGQTLIFGTSIAHCENIAAEIEGAVVVSANTKNRDEIIRRFTNKEIKVLVNCMIFTEGTDMPLVETIIICRPTKNSSLYAQMVGRGLRLHKDKDKLNLIDLVGVTGKNKLCTAASLLGLNVDNLDDDELKELDGNLLDIPRKIKEFESPRLWIKETEEVNLWAKERNYNLHNINWTRSFNGDLILILRDIRIKLPCQDELGYTVYNGERMKMQDALDKVFNILNLHYQDQRPLWDLYIIRKWGNEPASSKQMEWIKKYMGSREIGDLTKGEAHYILNRLFNSESSLGI